MNHGRTIVKVRRPCMPLVPRPADVVDLPLDAAELRVREVERVLDDACRLQPRLEDILCGVRQPIGVSHGERHGRTVGGEVHLCSDAVELVEVAGVACT